MSNRGKIKTKDTPWKTAAVDDVAFTVGTEATNAIVVQIQAKARGRNVGVRTGFDVWLSDAATGAGEVATAPSGAVAAVTNGSLMDYAASKKKFLGVTGTNGRLDVSITESGAKTLYVCVRLPDGTIKVSGAVTFAA